MQSEIIIMMPDHPNDFLARMYAQTVFRVLTEK